MATIKGTDDNDRLNGTSLSDLIFGFRGHDIIFAKNGHDSVFAGEGNDIVDGGDGNDSLFGEEGNDLLIGGDGDDNLQGGTGVDILLGGDGKDIADGGAGDDLVDLGSGNDTAYYNWSVNKGTAVLGDLYLGGSGTDTFIIEATQAEAPQIQAALVNFKSGKLFNFDKYVPDLKLVIDNFESVKVVIIPTISISDVTVNEADGTATLTVTLSGKAASAVTVDFVTADGTALNIGAVVGDGDYDAVSGTLSFAASNATLQTATITVKINNDTNVENTENFVVNLKNPAHVAIADGQGVVTIIDNDFAQPPAAPTIDLDTASDSVPSLIANSVFDPTRDNHTNDTTPTFHQDDLLINNQAPGDVIEVFARLESGSFPPTLGAPISLGTAVADTNGDWSLTPTTPLGDGVYQISAIASNAAGNTNFSQNVLEVRIDTVSNNSDVQFDPLHDSGFVGDLYTNEVVLKGTAEFNGVIRVYDNVNGTPVLIDTFFADQADFWSHELSVGEGGMLADGSYKLTVVAEDFAGNVSAPSDEISITVDTIADAPDAPTLVAASDTGVLGDNTTFDTTPTIGGTVEPAALVKINGTNIGEILVQANLVDGSWEVTLPQQPTGIPTATGDYTIHYIDLAGNISDSTSFSIIYDTFTPVPTMELDPGSDSPPTGDNTTTDTTPTLRGVAEASSTVSIYDNNIVIGTDVADENGNWEFTPSTPLSAGIHSFKAQATDLTGNLSLPLVLVTPLEVAVVSAPVTTPTNLDLTDDSNTGSDNDNITADRTPTITGLAGAENGVQIFFEDGLTPIGGGVADANGVWNFTFLGNLADGTYTVRAQAFDLGFNLSPLSDPYEFVIDGTAPPSPTFLLDPASDSGTLGDGITNDTTPAFNGVAQPGSEVRITSQGVLIGTVFANLNTGNWSFTIPTQNALAEGNYTFNATTADVAGNESVPAVLNLQIQIDPVPEGSLFTNNVDSVSFIFSSNPTVIVAVAGQYLDGTQYNALGGDDRVVLPQDSATASASGYVIGTAFHGGDGNDSILTDNQLVPGGFLNYIIYGDAGNDTIFGGRNADVLFGGTGTDILQGSTGNDQLLGEGGNDGLQDGTGQDILNGGIGNDSYILAADSNSDLLVFAPNSGNDLVTGFVPASRNTGTSDKINLGAYSETTNLTYADLVITQLDTNNDGIIDTRINIDGTNTITLRGVNDATGALTEADFSFTAVPPPPSDSLFTEGDDGVLFGQSSVPTSLKVAQVGTYPDGTQYNALSGDDTVLLPSSSSDATFSGYQIGHLFDAGAGDDFIVGGRNLSIGGSLPYNINGGEGNDVLSGGQVTDVLDGGPGFDRLSSLGGDDVLRDGTGPDSLNGGIGNDLYQLVSDGETDHLVFDPNSGLDSVTGFQTNAHDPNGSDVIDLRNYATTYDDVAPNITQLDLNGDTILDTRIDIDGTGLNTIALLSVNDSTGALTESDFLFS